jgi:hypothetical protein
MAVRNFTATDLANGRVRLSAATKMSEGISREGYFLSQTVSAMTVAASDQILTEWIDLTLFMNVRQINVTKIGLASAGETLGLYCSPNKVDRFVLPAGGVAMAYASASSATMVASGFPHCRYFQVSYANGATPQTALMLAIGLSS